MEQMAPLTGLNRPRPHFHRNNGKDCEAEVQIPHYDRKRPRPRRLYTSARAPNGDAWSSSALRRPAGESSR